MKKITTLLAGMLNQKTATPTKVGSKWVSGTITAYRVGGVVTLKLNAARIDSVTARTAIASLPEGFRPLTEITGKPDGTLFLVIGTAGTIQVDPPAGGTYYTNITYVAALGGGSS